MGSRCTPWWRSPPATERRFEHLARYVTRPAIAAERLSLSPEGKVAYELRHPWCDGATHVVQGPLTFFGCLAALVPHPREHQLTYHGVLAPACSWRDEVAPRAPVDDRRPSTEELADTASPTLPAPPAEAAPPAPLLPRSRRLTWSELLERVLERLTNCS